MKILYVEDDQVLAKLLQRSLLKQHYQVDLATNGQAAWELATTEAYDLIVLDWMLPKLTGIEFCQQLRDAKHPTRLNRDTPILLMTALDSVTNKVLGLNAGADDYVVKPFDLEELLARIRALLRRRQGARSPLLRWGELCLNPNSCEVTYQGQPISLAAKEYELLELFLRHPDQIFSLDRLLIGLWATDEMPSEGAVRTHIKGLRQKLKHAGANDPIETIYKLGYRLKPPTEQEEKRKEKKENPVTPSPFVIAPEFLEVWQECRQSYCDRLSIIQNAVTALQAGTLTPEQQHQAEREAHTLLGSLGSFGFSEASKISRQIQQILKHHHPPGELELTQLSQLTSTLWNYLKGTEAENSENIAKISPPPHHTSSTTTLLIVDEDLPLAQLLAQEALLWNLQANVATNLQTAQQLLDTGTIDIILLDFNFSNSTSGLEFLAKVHSHHTDVPVVILTAEESLEKRVEAARLGSRCFLRKPIAPAQVLAAVTQVLQQTNQFKSHILLVDDDPALLQFLRTLLEPCGYQVTLLHEPQHFWQTLEQSDPDLLILDIELFEPLPTIPDSQAKTPPLSGIELCQVIRNDFRWNRLPVLFLSAHSDIETVQRSFIVGADDFLTKPVVAQELLTRVRTRLAQRQLWNIADLDVLTGIGLRRKAQEDLARLVRLAQRQGQPFSLAVLDLDHFKQINDQYGHATGDRVLSYLGKLLRQSFRREDILGRWGGEEFIIGMYGTTKQDGAKRLQEVLDRFKQYAFSTQNDTTFRVTFSAGIAQFPGDCDDLQMLHHYIDQALYQAKAAGRNQIFVVQ